MNLPIENCVDSGIWGSSAFVLRSRFHHNGCGIYTKGDVQIRRIKNCIFTQNSCAVSHDGGIADENIIENAVFYQNQLGYGCGRYQITTIRNCVFEQNDQHIYLLCGGQWEAGCSRTHIEYSNVVGGKDKINECAGNSRLSWHVSNIDTSSMFINPAIGNFHLVSGSPLIDSGHPGNNYNDKDGTRNDIGAYGGANSDW